MRKKTTLIGLVLLTIISCGRQKPARVDTFWDLPFDDKPFTKVAEDILAQKKIFEMDDCSRSIKTINDVFVRMSMQPTEDDTLGYLPGKKPMYFKNVLDSLKIPDSLFEKVRKQLYDTQLYSFYKSHDSVLFIVNGFLDTDWGYFYNPNNLGNDTDEFTFGRNNVRFTKTINTRWKRVVVH